MSERFLVTGALGCLGAWVVARLHSAGADVVGFDLGDDPHRLRLILERDDLSDVRLVQGDITDRSAVERVVDDHEITNVIHLAALQIPFCRENPPLGALVNVVGTANVLETCALRRDQIPGPLVYASSAAAYGRTLPAVTGEADTGVPATVYGVTKQANEAMARVFGADRGLPSIGIRPYTVYGPGRDQGVTSSPTVAVREALRGKPTHMTFGGRFQIQHARDVADVAIRLSRSVHDAATVANLGGQTVSMREVVSAITAAVPGAAVTFDDVQMPLPPELPYGELERIIGPVAWTPMEQGFRETAEHFARAEAA